jgi:hypothetical protein
LGECARIGQYVCNQDGSGTQCNAIPGTPNPEVCDGLDNDCDGQIDDGVLLVFYKDMDGDGWDNASWLHSSFWIRVISNIRGLQPQRPECEPSKSRDM